MHMQRQTAFIASLGCEWSQLPDYSRGGGYDYDLHITSRLRSNLHLCHNIDIDEYWPRT